MHNRKIISPTLESISCTDIYSTVTQDQQLAHLHYVTIAPIEGTTPIEHA